MLVGVQLAVLQPLVAISAHHHSQQKDKLLGDLLIEATRANSLLCALCLLPFYIAGKPLLSLWVGSDFGAQTVTVVQILLLGVYARQTLAPFATILLGTGEQRLVIMTVVYEGVTKLAVSIALGLWIGPIGVALGTLAGGLVCVASNMWLNFPRVRGFKADARSFMLRGIVEPAAVLLPIVAVAVIERGTQAPLGFTAYAIATAVAVLAAAVMARPSLERLRGLV